MKDYPDILGYVTGGERVSLNVAQLALAVAPRNVRAGRPFQALLLAQNTSHSHVELTASLNLPARDAKKQKDRFSAPEARTSARLRPGEVGYMALPVNSAADTAAGSYKLGVAVTAQAFTEASSLRPNDNGSPPDLSQLSPGHRSSLDKLRRLDFSTAKKGLNLRGVELEAPFVVVRVLTEGPASLPEAAQFASLWNLSEEGSAPMLLSHYRGLIENRVFPAVGCADHLRGPVQNHRAALQGCGLPA